MNNGTELWIGIRSMLHLYDKMLKAESIVVAVMRKFVLLIPLIYIMPQILKNNQTISVYMAEPIADLIAVTFTVILFAVQFKKIIKSIEK